MEAFEKAAQRVKDTKKLDMTDETKLELYSLFKQAKFGDNTADKPWAIQIETKRKW